MANKEVWRGGGTSGPPCIFPESVGAGQLSFIGNIASSLATEKKLNTSILDITEFATVLSEEKKEKREKMSAHRRWK